MMQPVCIQEWASQPEYKELILKYRKVLESETEETMTWDGLSFITGRPSFVEAVCPEPKVLKIG